MEKYVKYCKEVIDKNPNFNELFKQTTEMIDFLLNGSLEVAEFVDSLTILGGTQFPKVIIMGLKKIDGYEDFNDLLEQGLDEDFVNNLKILVAKYKMKFENFIDKENNPYGWKNISSAIVKIGSKEYLEIEYKLNNGHDVVIRDEPSDHLNYIYYVLTQIKHMKRSLSTQESQKISEEIKNIRKVINEM